MTNEERNSLIEECAQRAEETFKPSEADTDAGRAANHRHRLAKSIAKSIRALAAVPPAPPSIPEREKVLEALKAAVRIADEAREEWDKAPSAMKAGKLLIALSGHLPGYRKDIDEIHAAIAALDGSRSRDKESEMYEPECLEAHLEYGRASADANLKARVATPAPGQSEAIRAEVPAVRP